MLRVVDAVGFVEGASVYVVEGDTETEVVDRCHGRTVGLHLAFKKRATIRSGLGSWEVIPSLLTCVCLSSCLPPGRVTLV